MAAAPCAACGRAPRRRTAKIADLAWIVDVGDDELDEALRAARARIGETGRVVVEGAGCACPGFRDPRSAVAPASTWCRSTMSPLASCWARPPAGAGRVKENSHDRQNFRPARHWRGAARRPTASAASTSTPLRGCAIARSSAASRSLVPCGTTGKSALLTLAEQRRSDRDCGRRRARSRAGDRRRRQQQYRDRRRAALRGGGCRRHRTALGHPGLSQANPGRRRRALHRDPRGGAPPADPLRRAVAHRLPAERPVGHAAGRPAAHRRPQGRHRRTCRASPACAGASAASSCCCRATTRRQSAFRAGRRRRLHLGHGQRRAGACARRSIVLTTASRRTRSSASSAILAAAPCRAVPRSPTRSRSSARSIA